MPDLARFPDLRGKIVKTQQLLQELLNTAAHAQLDRYKDLLGLVQAEIKQSRNVPKRQVFGSSSKERGGRARAGAHPGSVMSSDNDLQEKAHDDSIAVNLDE